MSALVPDDPDQPSGHLGWSGHGGPGYQDLAGSRGWTASAHPAAPADGSAPAASSAGTAVSPSLVRRSSASSLLVASLSLLWAAVLEGGGIALLIYGEPAGGTFFMILGLPFTVIGLVPWGRRTVFDADGVHSSTLLSRTDTAWPSSRAAFVISAAPTGRGSWVATVEIPGASGSLQLAAPRLVVGTELEAVVRGELEVDEIWEWALARGYVHETVPGPAREEKDPAQEDEDPALFYEDPRDCAQESGWAGEAARAPGDAGSALDEPAATSEPTARLGEAVPVDHDMLAQEPLHLRAWPRERVEVLDPLLGTLLFGGYGAYLVARPYEEATGRSGILMGHGPLTVLFGVGFLVLGLSLLVSAWKRARTRLTVSREGLAYFSGLRTRRLEWPTSRSSIFVAESRSRGWTTVTVHVIGADGAGVRVPGLRWRSKDERSALRPALQAAETIWVWGTSRGVTEDDGGYDVDPSVQTELRRATTTARLEYLVSLPEGLGWE